MTQTPGPLAFEPHGGYGQDFGDPDMRMPFGYITAPDFKPLFELDHFFDCPPETLAAYAKLMAAAPELLTDGRFLADRLDDFGRILMDDHDAREYFGHVAPALARFQAALTKATL
jgi:hypothetical protein